MERYVVAAELQPGKAAEAERVLAAGPPFDAAEAGLSGHAAYMTATGVYLVFEGDAARQTALRLAREHLIEVARWQSIVTGLPARKESVPRGARRVYDWRSDCAFPATSLRQAADVVPPPRRETRRDGSSSERVDATH